jgi:N6-adenosine-specific RNA methylase IME4
MSEPLPAGPYDLILADPPWLFVSWGQSLVGRQNHYPRMATDAICALPVRDVAAPAAALLLWATGPRLPDALEVMTAWGFTYKALAFTWVKVNADNSPAMGLGYYTRGNAELCLLGTRGEGLSPKAQDIPSIIVSRRRAHSQKPDSQYDYAGRLFGPVRRLELFARRRWPGWDAWGSETPTEEALMLPLDHEPPTDLAAEHDHYLYGLPKRHEEQGSR